MPGSSLLQPFYLYVRPALRRLQGALPVAPADAAVVQRGRAYPVILLDVDALGREAPPF